MLPIDELRETLLAQRLAVFQRVAKLKEDLRWLDANVEPEPESEGQEENIARLLARLDDHGKRQIEAIDRALARIASGEYGRCASCGKLIPEDRLRALPVAETCLPCASARGRG